MPRGGTERRRLKNSRTVRASRRAGRRGGGPPAIGRGWSCSNAPSTRSSAPWPAVTASASHRVFSGWPAWPFTQWNRAACLASSASSACQRSTFRTAFFAAVRQPLAFQRKIQFSWKAFATYWESVWISTCARSASVRSARIAPANSIRLLVVHRYPCASSVRRSPRTITAAQPPGPGLPEHAPSVKIATVSMPATMPGLPGPCNPKRAINYETRERRERGPGEGQPLRMVRMTRMDGGEGFRHSA